MEPVNNSHTDSDSKLKHNHLRLISGFSPDFFSEFKRKFCAVISLKVYAPLYLVHKSIYKLQPKGFRVSEIEILRGSPSRCLQRQE